MIAILCPTRGRPEQCRRMIDSAIKTSSQGTSLRFHLGVGSDIPEYEKEFPPSIIKIHSYQDNLPTVQKWNMLAEEAKNNPYNGLFMLGADDMIFETAGWDKALIDHYNALENKIHVYALQDSRDETGTPHPIVTREYIEAMGYFLPPIFLHWFCDTWTVEIARANNCFTHLTDYSLRHKKPSDHGNPDETHSRIRSWGWNERDKYVNNKLQPVLEFEKNRLKEKINA